MNFREYLGRYRSFRDLENITKDEQNNALFRYILRKKKISTIMSCHSWSLTDK